MRTIVDASKLDFKSTIVSIRRVAKTAKGGRNMRFSVTVVVGDGNGHVGVGPVSYTHLDVYKRQNQGPTMKRWRAGSRGSASLSLKRSSHVGVTLREKE